jgi:2-polyprenyl-3-methyl-5-hydroxy-6-metoxy-1,4-benzoquinol methylase
MSGKSDSEAAMQANRAAWNSSAYAAWVQRLGVPAEAAARIREDPERVLRRLRAHLGPLEGRTICNLQGSHGRVAVALALSGARVTVLDFSEANQRYALELAAAACVRIDYRLADVMAAPDMGYSDFDLVLMELGILHYHSDLSAFFRMTAQLLGPSGELLINEYHPVERKMRAMAAQTGSDYFFSQYVAAPVPFGIINGETALCHYRFWTLAEIVTAILAAGYELRALEEHPGWDDPKLPGTFTIRASLR